MDLIATEYRTGLHRAITQVADLTESVEDFSGPGLGAWDLAGLVGHFLRAVRTPLIYLEAPEPTGEPIAGAAHYVVAYLQRREQDGGALDRSVAERGAGELADTSRHPCEVILEEAARLDTVLSATPADRLLPTPFDAMRLGDYLRTRAMEIVVHGTDIARALEATWSPPELLVTDVLALLGEVAVLRGTANDLIAALTGRTDPADVLPVLR